MFFVSYFLNRLFGNFVFEIAARAGTREDCHFRLAEWFGVELGRDKYYVDENLAVL